MKWKNAFFVAVAAFIATLSWAIKLNNEIPVTALTGNEVALKNKVLLAAMHDAPTITPPADVTSCDPNDGLIPASTATCRIDAYKSLLQWLIPAHVAQDYPAPSNISCLVGPDQPSSPLYVHGSGQVISSFYITDPCELASILNAAHDVGDKIYAYMALQPQVGSNDSYSGHTDGHRDVMLDLIFKVHHLDPKTGDDLYYDFTSPCPPMCDATQCEQLPNTAIEHNTFCNPPTEH